MYWLPICWGDGRRKEQLTGSPGYRGYLPERVVYLPCSLCSHLPPHNFHLSPLLLPRSSPLRLPILKSSAPAQQVAVGPFPLNAFSPYLLPAIVKPSLITSSPSSPTISGRQPVNCPLIFCSPAPSTTIYSCQLAPFLAALDRLEATNGFAHLETIMPQFSAFVHNILACKWQLGVGPEAHFHRTNHWHPLRLLGWRQGYSFGISKSEMLWTWPGPACHHHLN